MSYNPQNPNGQATSANSSPVVIASDQSAVPISAASLPLPSSAATSTKQSDGSQKTQVVDGSGNVIGSTSNALDINIKSGNPTTITATQATGSNLHTVIDSGTVTTVSTVTNLSQLGGTAIAMNTGTRSAGTQRVTIATDDVVPVSDNSGSLTVDAPLGTPVFVTATPSTTGGWSKVAYSGVTTTKKTPKTSAGTFGGYFCYNPNSSVTYMQVFDVASGSVTLGTTAPDMTFGIPANSGANLELTLGVNMANAITLACTTTATGNTAPGTGMDITIFYK